MPTSTLSGEAEWPQVAGAVIEATKCAASTKKTARLPVWASAKRGSNFFLILFLHIGVAFGGQYADLATVEPEVRETQADLRGTASDACQGFEHRDRFVDGLGRMLPAMRFNGVPRGA